MTNAIIRAIRGRILTFADDPATDESGYTYIEDGMVVVADGHITAVGNTDEIRPSLAAGAIIDDHSGSFVMPGFIDTHTHYPQAGIIASFGAQLLDWLEKYTFPEEERFADEIYAAGMAGQFLDALLRNGTTTAAVYCTVHPQSVDVFMAAAETRNMRMIAGKVLMDRNAPDALRDTAEAGYEQSERLIEEWHGRERLAYAITPRFALTSSEAQLEACGELLKKYPDVYLQTHLSETQDEVAEAARLFPSAANYTDIYDRFGLLGPKSIFGHGIHLEEAELLRLHESRSVIAFCPSSNLFMGSGLFDLGRAQQPDRPIRIGLATDIGAGTSYSMLRTAADAYKALHLQGQALDAFQMLYQMTLGNARALSLEDKVGSLEAGKEADIVVLDPTAVPTLAARAQGAGDDLAAELFAIVMLGDSRIVRATYIAGERQKTESGRVGR